MNKKYGKFFLGLMIVAVMSIAGSTRAHAGSCTVNSDCVFEGWYEDLAACKTNAYNSGYPYFDTGASTNCSDGNACIACYFCPSANKAGGALSSAPNAAATTDLAAPQALVQVKR
jgi:hypothetical protein